MIMFLRTAVYVFMKAKPLLPHVSSRTLYVNDCVEMCGYVHGPLHGHLEYCVSDL